MAPPRNAPSKGKAPPKGGGNVLTTRYGPLPLWGWLGIAVVGYLLYRRYSSGAASSTTAATGTAAPATETVTTPYGSYTGPAQGGIPSSVLGPTTPTPGPGPTPGGGGPTPGNGGTPGGAMYSLITSNVAQTVQSRLSAGQPVLYAAQAGQAAQQGQGLVAVTQPTPGGGWQFGGSPTAPGNPTGGPGAPSGYYVPVPAAA